MFNCFLDIFPVCFRDGYLGDELIQRADYESVQDRSFLLKDRGVINCQGVITVSIMFVCWGLTLPSLGRPCVETELAATEKSATDGD